MSWTDANEPRCAPCPITEIETTIDARPRDLGGFSVGRVLPSMARRLVGPFIFFDHMGPATFAPGTGMDVRPHPHINLATVTYLFEGAIMHRDSLGSEQLIRPGEINWMTAGRGIVHSERTPMELRRQGFRAHGLQLWVALPKVYEEVDPEFTHYAADALPEAQIDGVSVRVLAGSAYGLSSPVRTHSRVLYVEALLPAGSTLALPADQERACYVVEGAISCGAERAQAGRMLVFTPGSTPSLRADTASRIAIIGGEPLDGPRHVDWNFVSSSKARIEQAKADWKNRRFPSVPGDATEFIPLPDPAR